MPLSNLPPDARPREKLLARGPQATAGAERLALVLRTDINGVSVVQMAQNLLDQFGRWHGLLHAGVADLGKVKGLGTAKRAKLAAVPEIARRSLLEELAQRPVFEAPEVVREFLRLNLAALIHEVFAVLFLDTRHRLIAMEELFRGTLAYTTVHSREVVKRALDLGAAAVILVHDHPLGAAERGLA